MRAQGVLQGLDAHVVGAPVLDGFLDLFVRKVLREASPCESGQLDVRGKAQGDELPRGELVGKADFRGGQQRGQAETFFQTNEAVLIVQRIETRNERNPDQDDGHGNGPPAKVRVLAMVADCPHDAGCKVQPEDWDEREVELPVIAMVIAKCLCREHRVTLRKEKLQC